MNQLTETWATSTKYTNGTYSPAMPKTLLIPIIMNTGSLRRLVSIIEDRTELIDSGKHEQHSSAKYNYYLNCVYI